MLPLLGTQLASLHASARSDQRTDVHLNLITRYPLLIDPLSEIVQALVVDGAIPLLFESCGPYAMRFGPYEHLKFGAVLRGRFSLQVEDGDVVDLEAGDCYLLTDGRPYRTFNDVAASEIDGTAFFNSARDADGIVRLGGSPPDKVVIGGRLRCDPRGIAWLRAALPTVVHVSAGTAQAEPIRATLGLLRGELAGTEPGQSAIVDRLAVILLVQALRAHIATTGSAAVSWLAGLADARIGRAMQAFHADVAAIWTVSSLAQAAGMSRSSFAERFSARVGMAPLEYVTRWRLHRVHQALTMSERPFSVIAAHNGYSSRTSCSQAFRRRYGCSPTTLRNVVRID